MGLFANLHKITLGISAEVLLQFSKKSIIINSQSHTVIAVTKCFAHGLY